MNSNSLHQWSDIGCISNPNIPQLPRVLLVVMNVFLITISIAAFAAIWFGLTPGR